MGNLVVIRHGETDWSAASRHTSFTDLPLTPLGQRQAIELGKRLPLTPFAAVLTSPLQRATHTAALAGLANPTIDDDLREWNYGTGEGHTKAELWAEHPDWNMWRDGFNGGETPEQVAARADRVIATLLPLMNGTEEAAVAVVGHGHMLRVLAARWVSEPARFGQRLYLQTASISVLGFEHGERVIKSWNQIPDR